MSWEGRSVFVTGHTGFKGSWLCVWLAANGAKVHGFSDRIPTTPSLFESAGVRAFLASDDRGDVADAEAVQASLRKANPDVVFHLAAQPLVRRSYREPNETYRTNVVGTSVVLEATKATGTVQVTCVVTSDKCYENDGRGVPFVETDRLGGSDPYSASKGAAEIVTSSFRYANPERTVLSLRAGNVIGGGDWSEDRIVPDVIRAHQSSEPLVLRQPDSTRPWQDVRDCLSAYVLLADRAVSDARLGQPFNVGPDPSSERTVGDLVSGLASRLPGLVVERDRGPFPPEAKVLALNSQRIADAVGWKPRLSLDQTLDDLVEIYTATRTGGRVRDIVLRQINELEALPL